MINNSINVLFLVRQNDNFFIAMTECVAELIKSSFLQKLCTFMRDNTYWGNLNRYILLRTEKVKYLSVIDLYRNFKIILYRKVFAPQNTVKVLINHGY